MDGVRNEAIPVSELVRQARHTLERGFPLQWVGGEIASLTRAASGHLYFSLRDDSAQVRCVMYRSRAQLLLFRPQDGQRVQVRALVTLYEARGEFQLQVETIRQVGQGQLFEAFLRLKERLATEGLFDPARKRSLPHLPRAIGIVTSPQAAALHDVLTTLARRAPHVPLRIYPSLVQGTDAGAMLANAVADAGARAAGDCIDVLILCRGGGSLEDLWAFNDERLVKAIAASPIPVVCGIGHETDFTLADFAADLRAPTPTAAAELVSAGHLETHARLVTLRLDLARHMRRGLDAAWERCDRNRARLIHPRERIARQHERCAHLEQRLKAVLALHLERARTRYRYVQLKLDQQRPDTRGQARAVAHLAQSLQAAAARRLARERLRHTALTNHLQHLNPQAVLERGYAIVRTATGEILRDAKLTRSGDHLHIQPAHGQIEVRVESSSAKQLNPSAQKSR